MSPEAPMPGSSLSVANNIVQGVPAGATPVGAYDAGSFGAYKVRCSWGEAGPGGGPRRVCGRGEAGISSWGWIAPAMWGQGVYAEMLCAGHRPARVPAQPGARSGLPPG